MIFNNTFETLKNDCVLLKSSRSHRFGLGILTRIIVKTT
jgi:hypothetical protein